MKAVTKDREGKSQEFAGDDSNDVLCYVTNPTSEHVEKLVAIYETFGDKMKPSVLAGVLPEICARLNDNPKISFFPRFDFVLRRDVPGEFQLWCNPE